MKKKKGKKPAAQKPTRFCDPAACDCCQYIGDGDFMCDKHMEIVVSDWEPTENFMICKRRNYETNLYTKRKS